MTISWGDELCCRIQSAIEENLQPKTISIRRYPSINKTNPSDDSSPTEASLYTFSFESVPIDLLYVNVCVGMTEFPAVSNPINLLLPVP